MRQELEPTEAFGAIVRLTPGEIAGRIAAGDIRDCYTMAALLLARLKGKMQPP